MSGEESTGHAAEVRGDFEKVAFEHLDALYRTALRMTRNRDDAEDLVQDAYLRAYRYFHQYRPGSNFRAWIFKILRNRFINQYRRKRRDPATVGFDSVAYALDGSEGEPVIAAASTPGRTRHEDRMSRKLEDALAALPEGPRTALVLAYVEGFRYHEIAEIMGWPIGTVMSRIYRARKKLRDLLEGPSEPPALAPSLAARESVPLHPKLVGCADTSP